MGGPKERFYKCITTNKHLNKYWCFCYSIANEYHTRTTVSDEKFYKPLFLSSSLLYLRRGFRFLDIYFGSDKRHFTTTFKKAVPLLTPSNVWISGAFKFVRKIVFDMNVTMNSASVISSKVVKCMKLFFIYNEVA